MRIGFDARYIQDRYHGIGRYAFELVKHLLQVSSHHEYVIFYNPDLPNHRFPLNALLNHPKVEAVLVPIPLYRPQEQLIFPKLASQRRLDLLHVPYFAAPLAIPCPLVLTIHDLIFERYPVYKPRRLAGVYYQTMLSLGLRRAAGVVTVSEATRRDLRYFYRLSASKLKVTPEAADAAYCPASQAKIEAIRHRYHLPASFILVVGARRPHKNIGMIVQALSRIRDRVPHALVLAGERDQRFADDVPGIVEREKLQERVIDLGVVAEADLPILYSAASVYVCLSLIEGFGLPVLEAFSCGVPVVASNRSSLPEVAGDAALLVDPTDEQAVACALARVLSEPELRSQLRRRGLRRADCFSWERTAKATLTLYQEISKAS